MKMKKQFKILIVDDDPEVLFMTTKVLSGEGYEVHTSRDGNEAIERAVEVRPDLILLDVMLPDKLGPQVMLELKSHPSLASCLIILISSIQNSSEEQAAGLESGADGYLSRPISNKELKARIKVLLNHKILLNKLKASEMRFTTMIDKSADGILVLEPGGNIHFANPAAKELFRKPDELLYGYPFGSPMLIRDKAELDIIRGKGSHSIVEMRIAEIELDNTMMILSTLRDVTERKIALKKVERLNALLLAHQKVNQIIVRSEPSDGMFTGIARELMESMDYLAVFLVIRGNENVGQKIIACGKEEITSHFPEVIKNHQFLRCNHRSETSSPVFFWGDQRNDCAGCILNVIPGNYHGYCCSIDHLENMYGQLIVLMPRGVEREEDEEKLLSEISCDIAFALRAFEYKKKSEDVDNTISSILLNMNHEVRTPMNAVLGFSDILKNSLEDPDLRKMSEIIRNSAGRLMQTLEKVMEISELGSFKGKVDLTEIDMGNELGTLVKNYRNQLAAKGLGFRLELHEGLRVKTHVSFLLKILGHLMDNAVKFTHTGEICISVSTSGSENISWADITVSDTGIGIPETRQKQIFDAFRQVSEGYSRRYEGIGLGLTLANMMTQLMNGKLTVTSVPDKGSVFTLHIPVEDVTTDLLTADEVVNAEANRKKIHRPVIPGQNRRFLIVEDSPGNVEFIQLMLRKFGISDAAVNGEDALVLVKKNKYDVIFMDINLGTGMDGLELTRFIRKIPAYSDTPIIALTGYSLNSDREQFLKEGCSHYLKKPFTRKQVEDLLEELA